MAKMLSFWHRWGLALVMMALIFGFSSIPSTEMPDFGLLDLLVKKGGHALGYALLALSYLFGLLGAGNRRGWRWYALAWIMATLYSATDEFHQSFVPGRHPHLTDVLIDSLGAAAALILATRIRSRSLPSGPSRPSV